jgi:hypothetical protein
MPFAAINMVSQFALGIDAERVSGAASLVCDCLTLVPIAEGWCSAYMGNSLGYGVQYAVGPDYEPLVLREKPDGRHDGFWMVGNLPQVVSTSRIYGGLPTGSGILVLAAQRYGASGSTLTDTCTVELDVYPRWDTGRGAS